MAIATSGPQSHSDHRIQLLKDIKKIRTDKKSGTTRSDALLPLLTSMTSYLEYDQNQDDFGDVDDEELMLAETSDATVGPLSQDLKRPCDFGDGSPSKKPKTENGSTSIALAQKILKDTWGFSEFKNKQEQAITRLIDGGSAVVVFPTGGGKSLVYQIPALAFDYDDELHGSRGGGGVTLVVSPLVALMKVRQSSNSYIQNNDRAISELMRESKADNWHKDQVDALKKRGVCAAAMDSSQSRDAWLDTCDKLRREELKLL